MPSELRAAAVAAGKSRWAWLSSQGLGVLCGQGTAILLALGSVALAATRGGASAMIRMDDIRGFFVAPSAVHLWFYLLLPVLALYALNTGLATWQDVMRKWRRGVRSPQGYAPALIHVAFLIGLLAHGIGGLGGTTPGRVIVGPNWGEIGDGRQARLTALDVARHPDGTTRQVRASLDVRMPGGATSEAVVRYNGPLSRGLGSDLLLLIRPEVVAVARVSRGAERCELEVEDACDLGGVRTELLYLHPPSQPGQSPFARLRVQGAAAAAAEVFWLLPGESRRLADGSRLSLDGTGMRPAVLLQRRHAPGDPWALFASILLALGLASMWRRFLPETRRGDPPSCPRSETW